MPTSPRPCVILTRRRTGAGGIHTLLSTHVPGVRLGIDPFAWTGPLGEVSRRFHAQAVASARELLLTELGRGVFFKHAVDTESLAFNGFLLQALSACGYRVIRFEREDEAERLFSLVVASQFGAWDREGIDGLRERLRQGEALPAIDLNEVRQRVREERDDRREQDAEQVTHAIDTLTLSCEAFFRHGLQVLALADELFAFAGAGARRAVLDDASLLRFVFSGEHHTLGLRAHSAMLREVHRVIAEELAHPTPSAAAAPGLHLVSG